MPDHAANVNGESRNGSNSHDWIMPNRSTIHYFKHISSIA